MDAIDKYEKVDNLYSRKLFLSKLKKFKRSNIIEKLSLKTESKQQSHHNFNLSKWQFETQEATRFTVLNGFISQHCVRAVSCTFFHGHIFRFQSCCISTTNLAARQESACWVMYLYVLAANPMRVLLVIFVILYCVFCISYCFFAILSFFLENHHMTLQIACCILKDMIWMDIGKYW